MLRKGIRQTPGIASPRGATASRRPRLGPNGNFANNGNDDLFEDDDVTRGDAQMVYGNPEVSSE